MDKKEVVVPVEVKPAAAAKKPAAKKTAAEKPAAKKAAAKKPAVKKTAAKKAEMAVSVTLQVGDAEWALNGLKERVLDAFVAEGHRKGNVSELAVYVKPEEGKVYYVVNGKSAGSMDL